MIADILETQIPTRTCVTRFVALVVSRKTIAI